MTDRSETTGAGAESALVIEVPEVEPLVSAIRLAYDPAAEAGVPAHVTILFPFVPPARIDAPVLDTVGAIAARSAAFEVTFARVAAFETAIYLDPVPDAPFRALTAAIHAAFPAYPPYEGRFEDVIPHLTLAMAEPPGIDSLFDRLTSTLAPRLPISVAVDTLDLLVSDGVRWHREAAWPLGGSAA